LRWVAAAISQAWIIPCGIRLLANAPPDIPNARSEIEKFLKAGALGIDGEVSQGEVHRPRPDLVGNID
jgi:hypothetical protein